MLVDSNVVTGRGVALELRVALVIQLNHLGDHVICGWKGIAGLGGSNRADGKHNQQGGKRSFHDDVHI
jgi:hypothetical protein